MENKLSRFEIWALASAMFAQAVNITRWYIGDQAPNTLVYEVLAWIFVAAAIGAGIAFDAVAVVTVIGRRDGRRSLWGWLTAGAGSLFSAAIALDLYGGPSAGPWLHVGYPLLIFLFVMHLSTPRQIDQNDLEQARAETEQVAAWLEQSKAESERWRHQSEQQGLFLEQAIAERDAAMSANAQLVADNERAAGGIARLSERADRAEVNCERWHDENKRLLALLDQPVIYSRQNVIAFVQELRRTNTPTREIERITGWRWSTLESWIDGAERVSSNGHEVPA